MKPELIITIDLEGTPLYTVQAENKAAHRELLLWLSQPETRDRLVAAIDDTFERLPRRLTERGRAA